MEVRIPRSAIAGRALTSLLQVGVTCPAITPTTVTAFVTDQLGWEPAYLRDRISTMFVDGMVVDDPEETVVLDGSTVSLSAAMPGLVGATLRKGGFYASMRSQINWTPEQDAERPALVSKDAVQVRLYNLILREKGPALLARGILLDRAELTELMGEAWCATRCSLTDDVTLAHIVEEPV